MRQLAAFCLTLFSLSHAFAAPGAAPDLEAFRLAIKSHTTLRNNVSQSTVGYETGKLTAAEAQKLWQDQFISDNQFNRDALVPFLNDKYVLDEIRGIDKTLQAYDAELRFSLGRIKEGKPFTTDPDFKKIRADYLRAFDETKASLAKSQKDLQSIKERFAQAKAKGAAQKNDPPTSPAAPAKKATTPAEIAAFQKGMDDHVSSLNQLGDQAQAWDAKKLSQPAAIKIWEQELLAQTLKIKADIRSLSHIEEIQKLDKTLTAFDAQLQFELKRIKEGKPFMEEAEHQRLFELHSGALDVAIEALKKLFPPEQATSAPKPVAAPVAPAAPSAPALTDSAASSCRASLSRYPRVAPAMMTSCRNANAYSAKALDVYTRTYKGGMAKTLTDAILEIKTEEQAGCAIQIAQKYSRSMTSKFLRETCL